MERYFLGAITATVPGLGHAHLNEALKKAGSAEALYRASSVQLQALQIFSDRAIESFVQGRGKYVPEELKKRCEDLGIRVITVFDNDYPSSLKEIHDPPFVLYVKGELPQNGYHIGIVGSRLASPYGLKCARYIAKSMVAGELLVVSGGATGVDSAAHAAAVEVGGRTIAVLGCGPDIVYPLENKALFQGIIQQGGAIISEYPPGTLPQPRFFPARNRIIVGLCRGIVVCEAAIKSGALITARLGADEQREVYCVPGNIFEPTSVGCHNLIKQGAKLLDDVREIFLDRDDYYRKLQQRPKEWNTNLFANEVKIQTNPSIVPQENSLQGVSEIGKELYALLKQGPLSLENLVEQSGKDLAEISMELLDLQVQGLISSDQTQRYYKL